MRKDLSIPGACDEAANFARSLAVHDSHDAVECGGYVGCRKCGSVVSTAQSSAMLAMCRGWCPRGAKRPVRQLELGQLPRGSAWPSGEAQPRPRQLRRVQLG